jgi:glycerol-3-phosphate dehydrogenase (NAD(P)+)
MTSKTTRSIAVIGAGSWGTALAIQLARAGTDACLWGMEPEVIESLTKRRVNERFLPDIRVPDNLRICADLEETIRSHRDILLVVPSHVFRMVLEQIKPWLQADARIAWATKGFELSTGKLAHEVAEEVLGDSVPLAVVSGPTFATEVGQGLPTAMTVAATDDGFAGDLSQAFHSKTFKAYTSDDIIGVEVGGAVKNVLAIATGMSDGLGYGSNTRVLLITRGLLELSRFGMALGAKEATFMGLSGMGDLVLTCTDNQSRNRRMGLALAKGKTMEETAAEIGQVVEGVKAAKAVHDVSRKVGVEMPICEAVYQMLYEGMSMDEAVEGLMNRPSGEEFD